MKYFESKLGMEVRCYGFFAKSRKKYVFPEIEPELYTEKQLEIMRNTKSENSIMLKPYMTIKQKQYETVCNEKGFDGILVGMKQIAIYKEYVCDKDQNEKYYIDSYVSGRDDNVVLCGVVYCDFAWDGSHKERLVPFEKMAKIKKVVSEEKA